MRRQHGGGPVPARSLKQAWPSTWPRAGAQSTLKETKMDYVPLMLRIFAAYMGYNPRTFLWFRRPYNSCLLSSPPLFITTLDPVSFALTHYLLSLPQTCDVCSCLRTVPCSPLCESHSPSTYACSSAVTFLWSFLRDAFLVRLIWKSHPIPSYDPLPQFWLLCAGLTAAQNYIFCLLVNILSSLLGYKLSH